MDVSLRSSTRWVRLVTQAEPNEPTAPASAPLVRVPVDCGRQKSAFFKAEKQKLETELGKILGSKRFTPALLLRVVPSPAATFSFFTVLSRAGRNIDAGLFCCTFVSECIFLRARNRKRCKLRSFRSQQQTAKQG